MSTPLVTLVVAIPTYRRPELLADLLRLLPERVGEAAHLAVVHVLIVDNDPAASAREVVDRHAAENVRYVHEPRPGIAAARNRALSESRDVRLVAFIDDDERPRPGWLPALIETWRAHSPSAVMGRVISVFEVEPDPWVRETGAFTRRARPTGLSIPIAAAGNLLLDVEDVAKRGVTFDETLGLGGGEDTLFSRQLVGAGGTIVWCNESEAEDLVPPARITREWAMKRAFNGGSTAVVVDLRMSRTAGERAAIRVRSVAGGAFRAVAGFAQHVVGRLTGRTHADARGLRTSYRGRGMIAASWGRAHEHYARTSND